MTQATPDDKFSSPLPAVPEPKRLSDEIRLGRTRIVKFPDNINFVIEGQDYSAMPPAERMYWKENFDGITKQWVTNVMTAGPAKGMVSGRACHAFACGKQLGASSSDDTTKAATKDNNGTTTGSGDDDDAVTAFVANGGGSLFPGLDYIRQAQLLFWLDLSYMEYIGKWDKVHVKLRRDFFAAYGPGGVMEGGDLLLWVDVGILKGDEMDAEYVGCYEGTGFMAYDHHAAFESRSDAKSAELPSFFDKPLESKPIEW